MNTAFFKNVENPLVFTIKMSLDILLLGASWEHLGASWGHLGSIWGSMLGYVGVCWGMLGHLGNNLIYEHRFFQKC